MLRLMRYDRCGIFEELQEFVSNEVFYFTLEVRPIFFLSLCQPESVINSVSHKCFQQSNERNASPARLILLIS